MTTNDKWEKSNKGRQELKNTNYKSMKLTEHNGDNKLSKATGDEESFLIY